MRQDAIELSSRSRSRAISVSDMPPTRKRLYQYSSVIMMISIISNIPIFLEFTIGIDTETQHKRVEVTGLRRNENYIIFFKNGFEGIILMVLPLILMMYFNAKIIYTLNHRENRGIRRLVTSRICRNEMNLAKVLIAMDIVFLICNSGRVIVNFWELFHIGKMEECIKMGMDYEVQYV